MRACFVAVIITLIANILVPTLLYSETETDHICAKVAQAVASGNTQAVIKSLPDVAELWAHSPTAYLKSAGQVARVLGSGSNNSEAKEALSTLFVEVFEKNCPSNDNKQAAGYIDLKHEIALYFVGLEETKTNKLQLLALAKFVGEVRNRIIPNYVNRGTSRPGLRILLQAGVDNASLLTNSVQKEAYDKAVRDNEQDRVMNGLQLSLFRANQVLTFHLLQCCSRFQRLNQKDDEFITGIVLNARLTEEERKKLVH